MISLTQQDILEGILEVSDMFMFSFERMAYSIDLSITEFNAICDLVEPVETSDDIILYRIKPEAIQEINRRQQYAKK